MPEEPEPEPSTPVKAGRSRIVRLFIWAAAAGVVGAAAAFVPLPMYFGYVPGPVRDVDVHVKGATTYSSEGTLYMTTVSLDSQVTLIDYVATLIDPDKAVVSKESVTGGQSLDELQRQQEEEMTASKEDAEVVALFALGLAQPEGNGARVESADFEPAKGDILVGDVIVGIDGEQTDTLCDVGREIGEHEPGDEMNVEVVRNGEPRSLTLTAAESQLIPGRAFLGVAMARDFDFDSAFEVDFKTGRIAGPSAGLMFTLALYDQLTPDDLTGGRTIAGTGTISCDGSVGPIGGVEQKVAGAEAAGAEIFFSPRGNAEAARAASDDIRIVPVATFDDARLFLESLD